MAPTKPTLELLRSLSDEHVLRALMAQRRATRAEIAAATGLSKPTSPRASGASRRPARSSTPASARPGAAGVGTYYALARDRVTRSSRASRPRGSWSRRVDVYGDVVARRSADAPGADGSRRLREARGGRRRPVPARRGQRRRSRGPRDRPAGRAPRRAVPGRRARPAAPCSPTVVDGPVTVDNDVNWAARAEHARRRLRLPATSAKASAARSSATARSAAATPASRARSRT